mmetsp:Transcript_5020/g.13378  ORF Transcript_5020/g.13378 Transcript_5020/m.13378 type:complete len:208 (+) Transcript_5020:147-770(+)
MLRRAARRRVTALHPDHAELRGAVPVPVVLEALKPQEPVLLLPAEALEGVLPVRRVPRSSANQPLAHHVPGRVLGLAQRGELDGAARRHRPRSLTPSLTGDGVVGSLQVRRILFLAVGELHLRRALKTQPDPPLLRPIVQRHQALHQPEVAVHVFHVVLVLNLRLDLTRGDVARPLPPPAHVQQRPSHGVVVARQINHEPPPLRAPR